MNGIVLLVMRLVLGYSFLQVFSYLVKISFYLYGKRKGEKAIKKFTDFLEDNIDKKTDQEIAEMIVATFGTKEDQRKFKNGEIKSDFLRKKV